MSFKVGDTVKLKESYKDSSYSPLTAGENYPVTAISGNCVHLNGEWWVEASDVEEITEFKIGDTVFYALDTTPYEVIGLDGSWVWIKTKEDPEAFGGRYTVLKSRLVPEEEEEEVEAAWEVGIRYNSKQDSWRYPVTVISVDEDGDAHVRYDDGSKASFSAESRGEYIVS